MIFFFTMYLTGPANPNYLDCFSHTTSSPALDVSMTLSTFTVQGCREACKQNNYIYAGVTVSTQNWGPRKWFI